MQSGEITKPVLGSVFIPALTVPIRANFPGDVSPIQRTQPPDTALGSPVPRRRIMTWRLGVPLLLSLIGVAAPAAPTASPQKAEEVTIYRDEFGVPNVYATTEEGAVFGHGYAQAQDRLEELLKQYRRAAGTMAEAFGPEHLRQDYRQRLWQHEA